MKVIHGVESKKIERKYKIALDILRKCESENMSIADFEEVMSILKSLVMRHSFIKSADVSAQPSSDIYLSELSD